MKRDYLVKLGLSEEALEKAGLDKSVIDKIMEENGRDIEAAKGKSEVPTLQATIDSLQIQLKEATSKMDSFKGMKSPEELDAAIADWKGKLAQAEQKHADTVLALKRDHALADTLAGTFKARNVKAVQALLRMEDLKFEEKTGTFAGLKEQLEEIQKTEPYLFQADKKLPKVITSTTTSGGDGEPGTFREAIQARLTGASQPPKE